ncbi:MAG TPA: hypothetical protein VNX46_07000 [Candidatus Acidoferrum sp.]|nr:hypothetical protein [Candidatus Acidoferrum sp.]
MNDAINDSSEVFGNAYNNLPEGIAEHYYFWCLRACFPFFTARFFRSARLSRDASHDRSIRVSRHCYRKACNEAQLEVLSLICPPVSVAHWYLALLLALRLALRYPCSCQHQNQDHQCEANVSFQVNLPS